MRLGARGLVAVWVASGLLVACTETRRGLGDACLKGDDCLSGFCSAQVCVGAPPIASGAATAPAPDAGLPDATGEADAADDSGQTPDDAATDAGVDGDASTVSFPDM